MIEGAANVDGVKIETRSSEVNSTPFLPEVLPIDPGIPIPSHDLVAMVSVVGTGVSIQNIGQITQVSGEYVWTYPACRTNQGFKPMYDTISSTDFLNRYGFEPDEYLVDTLRAYANTAAMITGGADNGLETARVLQTVAIYNRVPDKDKGRLDKILQDDFGLPKLPSTYVEYLNFLDEAIKFNDSGGNAIRYMADHNMETPLESARSVASSNPGLLLTYLIRTVSDWSRATEIGNFEPIADQLQQRVESVMEANLGQLETRYDFVYANINSAMSLFSDLVTARRYPELYKIADDVLTTNFNIPREIRHNSLYLTSLLNQLLVLNKFVSEEDLDSGKVITRANMKTPASLLSKSVIDPLVWNKIVEGAKTQGLETQAPGEDSSRAFRASWAIDTLQKIRMKASETTDQTAKDLYQKIEAELKDAMIGQDDIIRARVDFTDSKGLNHAVSKIRSILSAFDPRVKNLFGNKARGEVFAASYSDKSESHQFLPFDDRNTAEEIDGENVAGWIINFVKNLPIPRSFYVAANAYLPIRFIHGSFQIVSGQDELGLDPKKILGGEIQMTFQLIRLACNLARQFYDNMAKKVGFTHPDWSLVGRIQEKVLRDLAQVEL